MQAIPEKFFNWIFNATPTDKEWRKKVAVRETELRKELKDLKTIYEPELKKAEGNKRQEIWAEYDAQWQPIEEELLSIEIRRWAIDVPEQWDTGSGFFLKPDKAMNAMKRAIRDERLKVLGHQMMFVNILVVILSLFVASLSLIVAILQ